MPRPSPDAAATVPRHVPSRPQDLYREPAYIVYMVAAVVIGFGSFIVYVHGRIVAVTPGRERSAWMQTMPVAYSLFSALVGTQVWPRKCDVGKRGGRGEEGRGGRAAA
eukprot:94640-Chlamydomonas_euryale.AAC.3